MAELERRRAELRVASVELAAARSADGKQEPMALHGEQGDASVYHSGPAAWEHGLLQDARDVVSTILKDIGERLDKHRRR